MSGWRAPWSNTKPRIRLHTNPSHPITSAEGTTARDSQVIKIQTVCCCKNYKNQYQKTETSTTTNSVNDDIMKHAIRHLQ